VLPARTSVQLVMKIEDSAVRPPEFVHGVPTRFTVIDGGCAPKYVEVELSPLAAYRLLGTPMHHFAGQLVDLVDLLGRDGRRLGEEVRDASTWQERFRAIDRCLLDRLETAPPVATEVEYAWRQLVASGGMRPIRGICTEIRWSHKHLITRFRHQVGIAPKHAARLIRFERVLGRVADVARPDWGALAVECGYADQSHLIRDFREFAGTTPAAFCAGDAAPG
jgi:methylphosphotriester-DNA--protein-cysteine methyltransferase